MHILAKRQIHILAGASGAGKTTLLTQILAYRQQGKDIPFGLEGESIAFVSLDRSGEATLHRIEKLGLTNYEFYNLVGDPDFYDKLNLVDHPVALTNFILKKLKKPFDILVLDGLALLLEENTLGFKPVAKSLVRLSALAAKRHITTVATYHATKARTDSGFKRSQDRISGSGAFLAYSDTQMFLTAPEEQGKSHATLEIIPHTAPKEVFDFQWDKAGNMVPFEGEGGIGLEPVTDKALIGILQALNMSRSAAYREVGKLLKDNKIGRSRPGLYYLK